jgi:putative oxidoreductase
MRYLVLLGRVFFAAMFIISGFGHFSGDTVAYAEQAGVPAAGFLVPFSGLLAILGGLSILLGVWAKVGALLLVVFLVPVTLMMHNFWAFEDPQAAMMQRVAFLKNLSMLGGALLIHYFGAGPLSVDAWLLRRRVAPAREPLPA